jgi:hypothetical protein
MRIHPTLNIDDITPDPELVGQLPPNLALYYLAVPLGREDGQVSVALAHPENTTALAILSHLLGGAVVPVRGAAGSIRTMLQRLQPIQTESETACLGWSPDPAWTPIINAWTRLLAAALRSPVSVYEAARAIVPAGPTPELAAVFADRYRLLVFPLPTGAPPDDLLSRATGPLLLVRDQAVMDGLRRILVVLRGYSSDDHVLDWTTALVQHTGAAIILLPLAGTVIDQLQRCQTASRQTYLRLRQGSPVEQIADEYEYGDHDLLVIAAEGTGAFVGRVLAEVSRRPRCAHRPLLVLKPVYA